MYSYLIILTSYFLLHAYTVSLEASVPVGAAERVVGTPIVNAVKGVEHTSVSVKTRKTRGKSTGVKAKGNSVP